MTVFFKRLMLLLPGLLLCLGAVAAHAACSSPAGNEADRIYNQSSHTYQFCNGTNWISETGQSSGGALTLISTQTASASASLAWTGLAGSNYLLTCQNIIMATTNKTLYLQFGEGATPTWEITNYEWSLAYGADFSGSGNTGSGIGSLSDIGIDIGFSPAAAPGLSANISIFSLSSGSAEKMANGISMFYDNHTTGPTIYATGGYYTGNTTAVTAIRVISQSGNITSGSCSLYSVAN